MLLCSTNVRSAKSFKKLLKSRCLATLRREEKKISTDEERPRMILNDVVYVPLPNIPFYNDFVLFLAHLTRSCLSCGKNVHHEHDRLLKEDA